MGSKKAYLKNAEAKETLLLLWGVGLALLQAFGLWLANQAAWRDWGVKKTVKFLSRCILNGVLDDEVLGCGGSP